MNRTNLISRISKLSPREKRHIYKLLLLENVKYTKNANGYFFDLSSSISNNVVEKIQECLALIEPNRELIQKIDSEREILREKYTEIIHERLVKKQKQELYQYENKIQKKDDYSNVISSLSKVQIKKRYNYTIEDIEYILTKYEECRGQKNFHMSCHLFCYDKEFFI
jgi:hypothetical protein